ncbi:hypothetical protein [Agrobacterium phage Atu_ph04]|uniref:PD-(D/E)XK endonuclease-like domain-containing protein n=1 Tax=Agrobacterium phage Atu_ph04 TaxID=2024263 RepID=A0A223W0S6_9CAUD|nr:exonuclease [Agrobacterium phage Atu_ph04]ASV44678.1 hypothetical protein [Agrobacterium phage Atu_ph04]
MSFEALKKQFERERITNPEKQFVHISDQFTFPEGWINHDLPTGRIYKNELFPGEEFFSATTVLGKIANMNGEDSWLQAWRDRVGEEEADRISKEATDRGSAMHDYLEKYLSNMTVVNKHNAAYQMFQELKPWCDDRIDAVIASEHALFSRRLKVAGRVDLVAVLDGGGVIEDGIETLVDFKTSRKEKVDADIGGYKRQVTIYAMLVKETTGLNLEMAEIWMSIFDPKVDPKPRAKKFEIVVQNYVETVIDELAMLHETLGNPINVDECKRFFCL